jgi:hypothetical protein
MRTVENIRGDVVDLRKKAAALRRLARETFRDDFQRRLLELAVEYERKAETLERQLASGAATIY